METGFLLLSGICVGLVLGSFATMLSYRLPRGLSIVLPPSHCPSCRHRLSARDLVPVFSWLLQRGKCRHCGAIIGVRYPVIEAVTAFLTAAAFVAIGLRAPLFPALVAIVAAVAFATMRIEKSNAEPLKKPAPSEDRPTR